MDSKSRLLLESYIDMSREAWAVVSKFDLSKLSTQESLRVAKFLAKATQFGDIREAVADTKDVSGFYRAYNEGDEGYFSVDNFAYHQDIALVVSQIFARYSECTSSINWWKLAAVCVAYEAFPELTANLPERIVHVEDMLRVLKLYNAELTSPKSQEDWVHLFIWFAQSILTYRGIHGESYTKRSFLASLFYLDSLVPGKEPSLLSWLETVESDDAYMLGLKLKDL